MIYVSFESFREGSASAEYDLDGTLRSDRVSTLCPSRLESIRVCTLRSNVSARDGIDSTKEGIHGVPW